MPANVADLREFYLGSLGLAVRGILRARVAQLWPQVRGENVVGYGYAVPLMRPFREQGANVVALMPAEQGVTYWPQEGPNVACFVEAGHWPLPDESVDRVLIMHGLEASASAQNVLSEAWRILKSGGRALIIAPNRRGFWAHSDHTPFGTGEPYSSGQLKRILRDHNFAVQGVHHALCMPPLSARLTLAHAHTIEKVGRRLFSGLSGVLMAEVGKELYSPLFTKSQTAKRRLILPLPESIPIGSPARIKL